jgi:polysaccharide export outer membrane protein
MRQVMEHLTIRTFMAGVLLGAGVIAPALANAQAPAAASPERDGGRATAPDVYRIGPEDALQVTVWKNGELTRQVVVRPDGKISLPLVNDVQAAGLTPDELREVLTRKLAEYMPSPEVSIIVSDIRSFNVSVIGEVSRPGRYQLKGWITVLDALALAGGFTQFASRSRIVILQSDGKTMKRIPFNYNKIAGEQENFYLRNGDIILVP